MLFGQPRVLRRAQDPAGPLQVVVDEACLREAAQNLAEERGQLVVVERTPARQGELEGVESTIHRAFDPLDDHPRGEADQPDHGLGGQVPAHLLAEEADDIVEHGLGQRVALARRPEDVDVLDAGLQVERDLFAEDVLEDLAVLRPGDADAGQDHARVARFHGSIHLLSSPLTSAAVRCRPARPGSTPAGMGRTRPGPPCDTGPRGRDR